MVIIILLPTIRRGHTLRYLEVQYSIESLLLR